MGFKFDTVRTIVSELGTKTANFLKHEQPASVLKQSAGNKPLFCHEYWKACKEQRIIRQTNRESVSLHGDLNGINHFFITGGNPKYMGDTFVKEMTPREMVSLTDMEFKRLKPTEKMLNVYRCIGEKPDFFSEYGLYKKRLGIKKGDVIDMKEYAYATSNKDYASRYLTNDTGIAYEIEVPKGSRVSRVGNETCDEIVFPRSSKFECIGTEHVKNSEQDFLRVKLRYIQPNEPWRNS